MTDRDAEVAGFLDASPWGAWARRPLAGDASNRRYLRLTGPGGASVVAMDAAPERGETVTPFLRVAGHLHAIGLGAPQILARDEARGILVIEDLGDGVFARLVAHDPGCEAHLYGAAVDVLLALHRHPAPPDLPRFQPPLPRDVIAPAWGWYRSGADGRIGAAADPACDALNEALLAHGNEQSVIVLRDFHAENLLWRPECAGSGRTGHGHVGLIDFQDALAGHPAYDLVSLLEDARRDVPPDIRAAMIARYLAGSHRDPDAFTAAFAVWGAQRNLRILGVFARLCLVAGKAGYVGLLPRVWAHLLRDLDHPALGELRPLILRDLPPPTLGHLNDLRARCASLSTP